MLTEITPEQERQWWAEMPKPQCPEIFSTANEVSAWICGYREGRTLQIEWERFKAVKIAELTKSETRVPAAMLEKVKQ